MHKSVAVITSRLPSIAVDILSEAFDVVSHEGDSAHSEDDLITMFSEADGVITVPADPVTRRVLESNPNLRIVANCALGTDNIDLKAARELGITVTNTPDEFTETSAQNTLAARARIAATNVKVMLTGGLPPNVIV